MKTFKLGIKGTETFKKNVRAMETEVGIGIRIGTSCEYLVGFKEFFIVGDYWCLIMEFYSCGDLEKMLKDKKTIPQQVYFSIFYLHYYIL
jgi:hypothetical protein